MWVTKNDVDKAINHIIGIACHYEALRDAQPYECPAYWYYHDLAINMHITAEGLMPK